mmetsp:Transcript_10589/g.65171  ORF Transcript_10589/g.65171 Transcript_10589/m.65171 type:complete len:383 (-) Transcript_10589:3237-4385(-)
MADDDRCAFTRVLAMGSAGEDVTCLQAHLKRRKVYRGRASGWYGPKTEASVQAYQRASDLVPDGVFGSACVDAYRTWMRQAHQEGDVEAGSDAESDREGCAHELRGLRVALDVGHGAHPLGFEVGSRGVRGTEEFQLNTVMSEEIARGLREKGARVQVHRYDEEQPERPWLPERGQKASGHHVFVSCHHNAHDGKTQGTETLVDVDGTEEDVQLAHHVQRHVVQRLWSECNDAACVAEKDRGVKWQNLGVLGTVPMDVEAACLVEPYFMDDETVDGYERIGTHMTRWAARGVVDGIRKYWTEKKRPMYQVRVEYENEDQMKRVQEVAPDAWCVRTQGREEDGCENDEIHAGAYADAKTAQVQMERLVLQGHRVDVRSTAEDP